MDIRSVIRFVRLSDLVRPFLIPRTTAKVEAAPTFASTQSCIQSRLFCRLELNEPAHSPFDRHRCSDCPLTRDSADLSFANYVLCEGFSHNEHRKLPRAVMSDIEAENCQITSLLVNFCLHTKPSYLQKTRFLTCPIYPACPGLRAKKPEIRYTAEIGANGSATPAEWDGEFSFAFFDCEHNPFTLKPFFNEVRLRTSSDLGGGVLFTSCSKRAFCGVMVSLAPPSFTASCKLDQVRARTLEC